jgi:hypothetical protein
VPIRTLQKSDIAGNAHREICENRWTGKTSRSKKEKSIPTRFQKLGTISGFSGVTTFDHQKRLKNSSPELQQLFSVQNYSRISPDMQLGKKEKKYYNQMAVISNQKKSQDKKRHEHCGAFERKKA